MNKQRPRKIAVAGLAIAAIIGILVSVKAEEKKPIPDHTDFKDCQPCHAEKQQMWEASGHSKAIGRIANNAQASADCYGCHSTEGFVAKRQGNKVDTAQKESFHTVSCLACHDPVNSKLPRKLAADPEALCESCHTHRAVLRGQGAKGIEDTRSVHSAVTCASCHMVGGNHRMKVVRPDDSELKDEDFDSCTVCHKDKNRNVRAKQLQDWQAEYKEKMEAVQTELNAINTAVKEKPNLLNVELKKQLADVRSNLLILTRDKSQGAHNLDYALEIMALASSDLKKIKAAAK